MRSGPPPGEDYPRLDVRRAGLQLGGGVVLVAGVLCVVGWLIVGTTPSALSRWDSALGQAVVDQRTAALDDVSAGFSLAASTLAITAALVVVVVVTRLWLGRWRESMTLAVSVVGEVAIFLVVAAVVDRSRPDLAQLDPAPPTSSYPSLTGPAPEQLWDDLVRMVEADGFTVERGDCDGANGVTRFDSRVVRVRGDVEPAQAVKTLAHELGHIRADHEGRFLDTYGRSVACRGIAEVEAESIAYVVTAAAGLDCGAYSVPYVAGWSGGDSAVLRDTASRVLAVAAMVHQDLVAVPGRSSSTSQSRPVVQVPRPAAETSAPIRL